MMMTNSTICNTFLPLKRPLPMNTTAPKLRPLESCILHYRCDPPFTPCSTSSSSSSSIPIVSFLLLNDFSIDIFSTNVLHRHWTVCGRPASSILCPEDSDDEQHNLQHPLAIDEAVSSNHSGSKTQTFQNTADRDLMRPPKAQSLPFTSSSSPLLFLYPYPRPPPAGQKV